MELVTRDQLPGLMALFGVEYGEKAIEAALRATGIKPTAYRGISGGRGRVSLFDPMIAWVLVSVWEANKRKFRGVEKPMEQFRLLYDKVSEDTAAKAIPGFLDNREFGAQLLMMTSPKYGMEPRDIRRITYTNEKTLEYSAHGRAFLVAALQAYNNVYGTTIASSSVDPRQGRRMKESVQLHQFAAAWMKEVQLLLEIDAYNDSEEANR